MNIDWASLGLVSIVTVATTEAGGDGAAGLVALGWTAIAIAGLVVLYGLYLLIPYFH